MKRNFFLYFIFVLIISTIFYSFRLTETPSGLTTDDASVGYNAMLISKTLRDESGRRLPIFPLTIHGENWKQPISIYASAIFFKIFGASFFKLRLVSVIATLISLVAIMVTNYLLLGEMAGILSGIFFIISPIILIHSHLAQENIMAVPFVSLWLLFLVLYKKKFSLRFLFISAIFLGLGIYSYKGMRALTPPLILTSIIYLYITANQKFKTLTIYCLGLSPFIVFMPWINAHYPGALFDHQQLNIFKYYDFLYPYLSSFDLSALFIKGDITAWHSTGFHGVFLISTLPLFIYGMVISAKAKVYDRFFLFLLVSFLVSPILFGQVGSVYRFSRLLIFVPFYVSFCTIATIDIWKRKNMRFLLYTFIFLIIFNFIDFVNYYWYIYPVFRREYFSENNENQYIQLAKISKEKKLTPFVYIEEYKSQGDNAHFYEITYFDQKIGLWKHNDKISDNSVIMTKMSSLPNMKDLIAPIGEYHYLVNDKK